MLSLEFKQTLRYLTETAELRHAKYQATIYWDEVSNHHYLLSAFYHTDIYRSWLIPIVVNVNRIMYPLFSDIILQQIDGQAALTFTFNPSVVDYYRISDNLKDRYESPLQRLSEDY